MISMAKKRKDYGTGIPEHEVEALARCLLPERANGNLRNGKKNKRIKTNDAKGTSG